MTEELVSYDIAVMLKEKGFPQSKKKVGKYTNIAYIETGGIQGGGGSMEVGEYVEAPTLSLAARWLREKHGYYPLIIPTVTSSWTFKKIRVMSEANFKDGALIEVEQPPYEGVDASDYDTYEQALSAGIKEALQYLSLIHI